VQSYNFNRTKNKKFNFSLPSLTLRKKYKRRPLNSRSKYTSSNSADRDSLYIKIIVRSFIYYVVIALASFFVFMGIFANINNLWGFFRPQVTYEDKQFGPSKPYLSTQTEFTKENTVNLSGTAESGKKVVLYRGGGYAEETISDTGNKFEFVNVPITAEDSVVTKFYVEVEDGKGNKSPQSNSLLITYDDKKPSLSVSDPTPDQRVKDFSRTYLVKGKTEVGAKITADEKLGRVDSSGNFTVTIALKDEVNVLKVVSTDKAGNESLVEVPVYYEKQQ